jgi:hypothetical protein
VTPDDVKYLAPFVLGHRIMLTHEARIAGRDARSVIATVLDSVAVPTLSEAEAKGGGTGGANGEGGIGGAGGNTSGRTRSSKRSGDGAN